MALFMHAERFDLVSGELARWPILANLKRDGRGTHTQDLSGHRVSVGKAYFNECPIMKRPKLL